MLLDDEDCDDGSDDNDGCATGCVGEAPGFSCSLGTEPTTCTFICGDGLVVTGEACDDGSDDGVGCATGCLTNTII